MATSDGPHRIVVMGVAGAGKTTVALELAARLGARYVEGDDLHPPDNVARMAAGVPLTDDDRAPWLDRLASELAAGGDVVATCSALRRRYRDVLRRAGGVRFVFLDLDPATAARRAAGRTGHFMPPTMVASQFETLERPTADEADVVTVDARGAIDDVVAHVCSTLDP